MTDDLDELLPAATHEAGHAVIGRALHFVCEGASISASGAGRATVHKRFRDGCAGSHASLIFSALVISVSGAAAERELLGRDDADIPDEGDRARQASLLRLLDRPDALALAEREAARLVHQHRGRIERVARALMAAGTLSGREIDSLIAQPTRPDPEPDRAAVREGVSP